MEAWDIYTCDFADAGRHPAVIFTPSRLLQRPDIQRVNVLFCQTLRGPKKQELRPGQVILDRADGLDWQTICYCQMLHLVPKNALSERRVQYVANASARSARSCCGFFHSNGVKRSIDQL